VEGVPGGGEEVDLTSAGILKFIQEAKAMAAIRFPRRYDVARQVFLDEAEKVSDVDMRRYQQQMEEIVRMRSVSFDLGFDGLVPLEDLSKSPRSEPDRKLIPRFGVALADEGEGENQLAKEAELMFGYSVLRRKLNLPGKLGEVLACLDIEPLNSDAVDKYKAEMILWRKKQIIERNVPGYGRTHEIDVYWRRVALGKCKEEVPLFALRKAV